MGMAQRGRKPRIPVGARPDWAQRLIKARVQSGMTQQGFAEAAGVPQQTIADYEGGRSEPTIAVFRKLAAAANTTAEWLLFDGSAAHQEEAAPSRPMRETVILGESDHRQEVGIRLRQLIDALGISYTEAARDMDITKNHLGNWMRGAAYPTAYELYRFCRVRGVNFDWVFLADPSSLAHKVVSELLQFRLSPEALPASDILETADGTKKAPRNRTASDVSRGKQIVKNT